MFSTTLPTSFDGDADDSYIILLDSIKSLETCMQGVYFLFQHWVVNSVSSHNLSQPPGELLFVGLSLPVIIFHFLQQFFDWLSYLIAYILSCCDTKSFSAAASLSFQLSEPKGAIIGFCRVLAKNDNFLNDSIFIS